MADKTVDKAGGFYLGETIDPADHKRTGKPVRIDPADLTTHGVIVGMTGSGKTGLAVVLIEEALLAGIPVIVLDPKGDMGNLALTFPELDGASFRPWVNEAEAGRDGVSVDEHAESVAATWRGGLESWGLDASDVAALANRSSVTIYTPGSASGVPIDLVGSLRRPDVDDAESTAEEIEGYVSSVLGLVGIDADPLASREHILLSNLIHHAWEAGTQIDLAALVGQVQDPPIRKLGVLDLDGFYPKAERSELAVKLNGLLASPSFAAWAQGEPLDMGAWLDATEGPKASIVAMSHLSDQERQFVTTLVLSKLVTWFRRQPGTPELRALVYMDEVFGFVPPTAAPPSKKPILTIMKQARAFGVGMVLATQNPVDVDYKAISNAGTWLIGRLQTERDKSRLLEGMQSATGSVDLAHLEDTISGLAKREFVLHQAKAAAPSVFTSRWAMSYLAGPLTRDQIARLRPDDPDLTSPAPSVEDAPAPPVADDESAVCPPIAEGVPCGFVDAGAPWLTALGGSPSGTRWIACIAARVHLTFDDSNADLQHSQTYEAVTRVDGELDPATLVAVDYDDRDLRAEPPASVIYVLPTAPIDTKAYFARASKVIVEHLVRSEALTLWRNEELDLVSRIDETREQFDDRCRSSADDFADADSAKLRSTLERRIDRVRSALAKAEDRVREAESDAESRRSSEIVSRAGDLLGGLLGGRRGTRSILGGLRRAASDRRQSASASERLESARNRVAEKVDEIEDLEIELRDALSEIQDRWDATLDNTDELTVSLERTDVDVAEVRLVWLPIDR